MKKLLTIMIIILSLSSLLFASLNYSKADELFNDEDFLGTKTELLKLEKQANTNQEKAEVYWRLSRNYCYLGKTVDTDDERLELYDKGIEYANMSQEASPNGFSYIWKASNYGRIGTIKGPLNSLIKASKMRDFLYKVFDKYDIYDSSEAFYVLAELFRQLPGRPFSFGNTDYAISYSRLAVETIPDHVLYPSTYFQLARLLEGRDWSANYRTKKFKKYQHYYKDETKMHEKFMYYESKEGPNRKVFYAPKSLGKMSDREEAKYVLEYAIKMYNKYPERRRKEDSQKMIELYDLLKKLD